jgi:hypothetical protein
MIYDDEYGAVGGMINKGNGITRRNPASVPLCPPQIPDGLTGDRNRRNRLSYGKTFFSVYIARHFPLRATSTYM